MPLSDEIKSLLLKYIAGEAEEDEVELIEEHLDKDPEVFKEFEQLWDLWYEVGSVTKATKINVENGWNELLQKIGQKEKEKREQRKFKKFLIRGISIAAVLAFLIFFLWYRGDFLGEKGSKVAKQSFKELFFDSVTGPKQKWEESFQEGSASQVKTMPRKRKHIQLPDGSGVWLDGNTVIRFSMNDQSEFRTVYLSGRAFFNVKRQEDKPFIVKTKYATIKVLGTRFNIEAYPEDSIVETTLTSGSLLMSANLDSENLPRQIKPGQKASVNFLSGHINIEQVDTLFYTSWKEGKLIFNNESFGEVSKAMEHKYHVSILFEDTSLRSKKLNGYFDKESLSEALTALELTLQFHYRIKENQVIISK